MKHRRLRSWLAAILVILACVAGLVTAIGFWSHGLFMNTGNFVGAVGPVLKDRNVTRTVGTYVADKVIEVTEVESLIRKALPDRIDFLASTLTSELDDLLRKGMIKTLRSEKVYSLWIDILTFAHKQALALLRNETTVVRLEGEKVIVDFVPLIAVGINKLDRIMPGVIGERVDLPEIDPNADPDTQREQLADALGVTVSPTFGQVVLFQSKQVQTAQTAVKAYDVLIWVMLGVTLLFAATAVVLSPRRWRTVIQLGLGAALTVVLVFVVIAQLKSWAVDSVAVKGLLPLISSSVERIVGSLRTVLWVMLGLSAALAVVAYLSTAPRWMKRLGGWLKKAARVGVSGAGRARGPVATWTGAHSSGLQAGGLIVAIVLLLFVSSSLGGAIAVIVLLALWEIAVVLVGGRRPSWLPGGEPQAAAAGAGVASATTVPAAGPVVADTSASVKKTADEKPAPKKPADAEPSARKPAVAKKRAAGKTARGKTAAGKSAAAKEGAPAARPRTKSKRPPDETGVEPARRG